MKKSDSNEELNVESGEVKANSVIPKRKSGPVFFVSNEYDCIITAPPEKKSEVGAYFAEVDRRGHTNNSYKDDFDNQQTLKKHVQVSKQGYFLKFRLKNIVMETELQELSDTVLLNCLKKAE